MPIMYVNPAPARRRRKVTKKKRSASSRRNPSKKKGTTMAKTKRRPATSRRRRKSVGRKKNPARSLAAKKAARTRAAKKAARTRGRRRNAWSEKKTATKTRKIAPAHSKAAKKGWRKRKKATTSRKKNPAHRMRRRNPSSAYARRYGARRRSRRGRRNPSNGLMGLMTQHVLPVAASLYASRLVSGKLSGRVPGLDRLPEQFRQPILAGGMFAAGHFATKKVRQLKKYRNGIMIGLGVNLLDKVLGAFAPESVKSMFGISNYAEDIYGPALSDYVSVNDYVAVDGTPIQDNITLSEYVAVGGYESEGLEQELGAVYQDLGEAYQDLGVEQDLGDDFADRNLGGVSRSAMRAPVGHKRYLAPIPSRSFTAPIPSFGAGFDRPEKLYTGVFAGGLH